MQGLYKSCLFMQVQKHIGSWWENLELQSQKMPSLFCLFNFSGKFGQTIENYMKKLVSKLLQLLQLRFRNLVVTVPVICRAVQETLTIKGIAVKQLLSTKWIFHFTHWHESTNKLSYFIIFFSWIKSTNGQRTKNASEIKQNILNKINNFDYLCRIQDGLKCALYALSMPQVLFWQHYCP